MSTSFSNIEQTLFSKNLDRGELQIRPDQEFIRHEVRECDYLVEDTRKINGFAMLHIEKGTGTFRMAMHDYEIKEKTIFFAYPGQMLSMINLKSITANLLFATARLLLKANPGLLDMKLFQLYGQRHEISLADNVHEKLLSLSWNIAEEMGAIDYRKNEILQNLLNLHIFYTDRFLYSTYYSMEKQLHSRVRAFYALMNIKQNVNMKVADYAGELNITPNYLNELVKNQTGKSAKSLIKEKAIRQACVFLMHTDYEVKEIAYQLGYNYPQYFNRDFKNSMGMTPARYRESYR